METKATDPDHAAADVSSHKARTGPPLRVGVDLSILRRPPSGSARWARGLVRALSTYAPDLVVLPWQGPPRMEWGGPLRKLVNLARERLWFDLGIPLRSQLAHVDVLLMPVNLAAGRGAPPQVVTIHDVNFLSAPGTYDRWYARYAEWAIRRAIADAAVITTVSQHSRDELTRWLGADPDRIAVIYPGLDEMDDQAKSVRLLDEPYALFVGATEPHKDVPLLLQAWSRSDLSRALRLVIVGPPGRDHSRVLELAASIRPTPIVTGAVQPAVLDSWYRGASLFVFPSRSEGFGFPPLEAMQRGIPVVASRAGSLPEVLGDAALFHDPGDVDSLAAAVRRVAADRELRDALIRRGLERAALYRWDRAAVAMARLLSVASSVRH